MLQNIANEIRYGNLDSLLDALQDTFHSAGMAREADLVRAFFFRNVEEPLVITDLELQDALADCTDLEEQVTDLEEQVTDLEKQVTDLEKQVTDLEEQVIDVYADA